MVLVWDSQKSKSQFNSPMLFFKRKKVKEKERNQFSESCRFFGVKKSRDQEIMRSLDREIVPCGRVCGTGKRQISLNVKQFEKDCVTVTL